MRFADSTPKTTDSTPCFSSLEKASCCIDNASSSSFFASGEIGCMGGLLINARSNSNVFPVELRGLPGDYVLT